MSAARSPRPVAIVGVAQLAPVARDTLREEVELVQPVVTAALAQAGLDRREVGFVCSGSCDYLLGRPFSFVAALDGVAPWPPIRESHVEMDGAWAFYEAWVRLQCGDLDTALVYAYGKSSLGELPRVLAQQLDPYYLAPLGVDADALARMQARALVDAGKADTSALAAAARGRRISDGAAAIVLAAGDRARALAKRPAWITGIDHRIEPHALGARDLTVSASTRLAASHAGARRAIETDRSVHEAPGQTDLSVHAAASWTDRSVQKEGDGGLELAFVTAAFPHEELLVREALGLSREARVEAKADPMIVAGLANVAAAAAAIFEGHAARAIAHATSGPCLQQNLVAVVEASP